MTAPIATSPAVPLARLAALALLFALMAGMPGRAEAQAGETAPAASTSDVDAELVPADPLPGPAVPVIVNIDEVVRNSKAHAHVNRQLEAVRKDFQKEVAGEEIELTEMREELDHQRSVLSQEAYDAKMSRFNERLSGIQRDVQGRRKAIENAYARANGVLRREVLQITAEYMDMLGANIVLSDRAIVLADKSMDITDKVLATLDKRMPEIPVSISAVEAGGEDDGAAEAEGAGRTGAAGAPGGP